MRQGTKGTKWSRWAFLLSAAVLATGGASPAAADMSSLTADCDHPGSITGDRCLAWHSLYDHPSYTGLFGGIDRAQDVAADAAGGRVFVTGYSWQDGGSGNSAGFDFATVAYDATTGVELWVARHDGAAGADDGGVELVVAPDAETVYVAGLEGVNGPPGSKEALVIVAYEASTGAIRWIGRHEAPEASELGPPALAVSGDGDRAYAAAHRRTAESSDAVVVAHDAASGTVQWTRTMAEPFASLADAQVTPDGHGLVLAGASGWNTADADIVTAALVARSPAAPLTEGSTVWTQRRDGGHDGPDQAVALAVSPDGERAFVTATATGPLTSKLSNTDALTVAYGVTTGSEHWQRTYSGPGGLLRDDDNPAAVVASGDGAFVAITSSGPTGCTLTTLRYRPDDGEQVWQDTYHNVADDCTEADDLAISPSGARLVVAGNSVSAGRVGVPNEGLIQQSSFVAIGLDPGSGTRQWLVRFNSSDQGLNADDAAAAAMSPAGERAFVVGTTDYQPPLPGRANPRDYGTIAVDVGEVAGH